MVESPPNPRASSASLSTRISLRWLPDPPFENTDTIVMSLQGWYLDLRVDTKLQIIDWAIAGNRIVESEIPHRVSFTHALDSHNAFSATDCGTFTALPNGDDLETGSMPRADAPGNPMTQYEEVWRELELREGPEGPGMGLSWILESEDENVPSDTNDGSTARTFIARVWGTYLVLRQTQSHAHRTESGDASGRMRDDEGGKVSARREEWNLSSGWMSKYVLGGEGEQLPSMNAFQGQGGSGWKTGQSVVVDGQRYIVRAFEEIA